MMFDPRRKILTVVGALRIAFGATDLHAEDLEKPEPPSLAKAKLERFDGKSGTVVILGYGEAGFLQARDKIVSVDVREVTNASTGAKQYGVSIKIREKAIPTRSAMTLVNADEIDSLIKGITYVAKLEKTVTKLGAFHAEYQMKGGLKVATYSNQDGAIEHSLEVSSSSEKAFLKRAELEKLREILEVAVAAIERIKK